MKYKKTLLLVVLFLFMYGAGAGAAKIVDVFSGSPFIRGETENWGLGFRKGRRRRETSVPKNWKNTMRIIWGTHQKRKSI